jgi:hypothetical protein
MGVSEEQLDRGRSGNNLFYSSEGSGTRNKRVAGRSSLFCDSFVALI